jgi:hypothetical protein
MTTLSSAAPCRCPACLPSIPPDPATATPAELFTHREHLRQLAAISALPDPAFQPYPQLLAPCPRPSSFPTTCATPASPF